MEEYQKIYLEEDKTVKIQCPACQVTKTVPVEKLPKKFYFIVKCSCGVEFVVQHDLRSRYRKNVHLTGAVFRAGVDQDSKWGKALNESIESSKISSCMIINISPIGVGIILTGSTPKTTIKKGDVLLVQFNLDNSALTQIEKKVTVKAVKNNYVGCEFFDDEKDDKDIKFYLL